ncbi:CobW domain-containing protein [Seminavis robusta]|uniref:CobW domain-containing protein n=1 Tax=Seminavis robusta TaxID=568900 RepID=A0A9N8DKM3_9STRA|nr:CobW domain-containing protein [Seminavis robusta]|eukprot:Sro174_g076550.1 CobW domain-containing protein (859) ;mRNA; f:16558-19134
MDRKDRRRQDGGDRRPHHGYRKPAWKLAQELPAFLDASASVSASTFAARRLPELKKLYSINSATNNTTNTLRQGSLGPLKSSGCKTSSRHLRRRATSHKARKRHRYPREGDLPSKKKAKALPQKEDETDTAQENSDPPAGKDDTPATSRRGRRKHRETLTLPHEAWWKQPGPPNGECLSSDDVPSGAGASDQATTKLTKDSTPCYWMTTHIWHSKRFHMAKLWGWQIPIVHTNRGPKAALRLIREGKTLLQDVTWSRAAQPIILKTEISMKHKASQQQQALQSAIQRICPEFGFQFDTTTAAIINDAPNSHYNLTCDKDICVGKGMLHALDQFPRQAIGPIHWLVTRGAQPLMGGQPQKEFYYRCYFWTHPAIHSVVLKEFEALETSWTASSDMPKPVLHGGFQATTGSDSHKSNVGMACFKLRGINATATVQRVLEDSRQTSRSGGPETTKRRNDNPLLFSSETLHSNLPNGTVLSALAADLDHPSTSNCRDDKDHGLIQGDQLLLVSQRPANLSRNEPAVGWDLYCDAAIAKVLFVELIIKGQACPIGIAEEAYIKLECDPPIADIFPRDYPETREGSQFWQLTNADDSGDGTATTVVDSTILRLCLQQGEKGGRIDVPRIKARSHQPPSQKGQKPLKLSSGSLCKIRWYDLIKDAAANNTSDDGHDATEDTECAVVMMRGAFCKPLEDALSASGNFVTKQSDAGTKGRKRRRVKQPNEICHVIPLTSDEMERHMSHCRTLLQSLSLPAVIACQLQVVGPGTLRPGAQICPATEAEPQIVGFVTATSFSAARGCSHGIGVVGAALLLKVAIQAASSPQRAHSELAVVEVQGRRAIRLVVCLRSGTASMKATLALLL